MQPAEAGYQVLTNWAEFGEYYQQHPEFLPPMDPVDGIIMAARSYHLMHLNSDIDSKAYFSSFDYYTGEDVPDNLLLLKGFQTYQQTSLRSCGACCVLMTVNYLTQGQVVPGENELDKEMDIRFVDNKREDGSYGATTASMVKALEARGFAVQSSRDTQDRDGVSFHDYQEASDFLKGKLLEGKPVIMENVEFGGHWMVLIGYDDMGTEDMDDDVLVFADPFDTSDHNQDGYYVRSFDRYIAAWFDHDVMPADEKIQQYVTIR